MHPYFIAWCSGLLIAVSLLHIYSLVLVLAHIVREPEKYLHLILFPPSFKARLEGLLPKLLLLRLLRFSIHFWRSGSCFFVCYSIYMLQCSAMQYIFFWARVGAPRSRTKQDLQLVIRDWENIITCHRRVVLQQIKKVLYPLLSRTHLSIYTTHFLSSSSLLSCFLSPIDCAKPDAQCSVLTHDCVVQRRSRATSPRHHA
jgi:hypothetical protein